ncbi:hypothetical protein VTJ83DRAFT_5184 [Remersonia thermophila]|uniref:Uncharacterized protein n=1 Tax=Remersonia thermophila TaxID=72144 RepID=A0ABR4DC37_9PEZI
MTMLGPTIARVAFRTTARPVVHQPRISSVRTVMYKTDGPDGTTSTMRWTPKTMAAVGAGMLAVYGGYGYMMAKPQQVTQSEASPASITERSVGTQQNTKGR